MNYQKTYNAIIDRAKARLIESEKYYECHHIIPKCMGGSDDPENLVMLTPEEHYLAHQLLMKIYPDNRKLVYAAVMMTVNGKNERSNNKLYGWVKRKRSQHGLSEETKRKIGESNSKALTGRKLSKEHAENVNSAKTGRKVSDEGRENIRQSKLGEKNPMYGKDSWNKGKKWSDESKEKMRQARLAYWERKRNETSPDKTS